MKFIQKFKGMPHPIVCPSFYKLQGFFGCLGNCKYCYLRATYIRQCKGEVPRPTLYANTGPDMLLKEFQRFCKKETTPQLLNAGELADCYDDQTEILTEEGWKLFDRLTETDRVATLSDGFLVYENPDRIIKERYKGVMYELETKMLSLCVTPKHNLWIAQRTYLHRKDMGFSEFNFVLAKATFGKRVKHKKDCMWIGKEPSIFCLAGNRDARYSVDREDRSVEMDLWLEFFGYFLTEGNSGNARTTIAQSKEKNPANYEKILQCIRKLGFPYTEYPDKIEIHSERLARYLRQFGKDEDRFIPKEIKWLCTRQLRTLFDAMIVGDGARDKNDLPKVLYTISKKLADDFQEVLLKIGLAGDISTKHQKGKIFKFKDHVVTASHDLYAINIVHHYLEPVVNHGHVKQHEHWKPYDGMIYCCTVTNHILYVRRKGKPVWSGNSFAMEDNWYSGAGPFSQFVIEMFRKQSTHKVLFLTKISIIQNVLQLQPTDQAIFSFSFNPRTVIERCGEPNNLAWRISSSRSLQQAGWHVRGRIDPILLDMIDDYESLIPCLLHLERITLGSLRINNRQLPRTYPSFWESILPNMVKVNANCMRFPVKQDVEAFSKIIGWLKNAGFKGEIALCKESNSVWKKLGLDHKNPKCNCVL